jgi:hypothetical protein
LVLFVGLCARPVAAAPILSIAPSVLGVTQGDTFFLDINITDVNDLLGFQFGLQFDPTVLMANEVLEGGFLPSGGSTFFIPGSIDNVAGLIDISGDILLEFAGVSGDGRLARVSFTAISAGTSALGLSDVLLLDSLFNSIDASTQGGSVTAAASTASPIPEPGTMVLVGSGLLVAWRNRRRLGRAA